MDPKIWSRLPCSLIEKICNMIPKVRDVNKELMEEIRFQERKFLHLYYNSVALFGEYNAYWVMYDDMRNILNIPDNLSEDMHIEQVVETLWTRISSEERDELIMYSD